MHILFIDWNSFGNEDIIFHFRELGHKISFFPISEHDNIRCNTLLENTLYRRLTSFSYDFVFSFDYFPAVSNTCDFTNVPYVAWIYDSPYIQLYSTSLKNSCNHVFIFNHEQYAYLASLGFQTVHFLPMGVNIARYDSMVPTERIQNKYKSDISFVGSLYTESTNQLFSKLTGISEYTKGYLDAIILAQKNLWCFFIRGSFNSEYCGIHK